MNKRNLFILIGLLVVLNIYPVIYLITDKLFDLLVTFNLIGFLILLVYYLGYKSNELKKEQYQIRNDKSIYSKLGIKYVRLFMLIEGLLSIIFLIFCFIF